MFKKNEMNEWLPTTAIELCEVLARLIVEHGVAPGLAVIERAREMTKSRPYSVR
jgi:hypothetical protein